MNEGVGREIERQQRGKEAKQGREIERKGRKKANGDRQ